MTAMPAWVPDLILLDTYGGDWKEYVEQVFSIFHHDFINSQPQLNGLWVRCRRDPICDGKEAGFWHCTSEGDAEGSRTPDLRRCERIAWVRAVIENAHDPLINQWSTSRRGEHRQILWFAEAYVVVLAKRIRKRDGISYWQLITAYCTDFEHTKRKLRRERDETLNG